MKAPEFYYKHVMKLFKTKNKLEALQMAADFTRSLEHLKVSDGESWPTEHPTIHGFQDNAGNIWSSGMASTDQQIIVYMYF